jgi:hypothetical protein
VPTPLSLSCHSGQSPRKNYSTFGMLVHVTPLNESSVCSNYGSSSSHIPKYSMCLQARIPPALGAIHNFIRIHDPNKIDEIALEEFDGEGTCELAVGPASTAERA